MSCQYLEIIYYTLTTQQLFAGSDLFFSFSVFRHLPCRNKLIKYGEMYQMPLVSRQGIRALDLSKNMATTNNLKKRPAVDFLSWNIRRLGLDTRSAVSARLVQNK